MVVGEMPTWIAFLVIGGGMTVVAVSPQAERLSVCHGAPVPSGKFPWLVRITKTGLNDAPQTVCTGSMISDRHVLTAAHCFLEGPPGGHSACISGSGLCGSVVASSVCVNPSWDPVGTGPDLAVITLDKPSSIAPLPLISTATADLEAVGQHVVLAGFGFECPGFPKGAAQFTDRITIIQRQECSRLLNTRVHHPPQPLWNVTQTQVCTLDNVTKSGAAIGDSGGLLFHTILLPNGDEEYVQLATVHGGQEEGTGLPDVYQRILPEVGWVKQVIAGVGHCLNNTMSRMVV